MLSDRGEAAVSLVNRALGEQQRQYAQVARPSMRPRLGVEVEDAMQAQRQAVIVRLVAITEAFCVGRLIEMSELAFAPDSDPSKRALFDDAIKAAIGSWPAIMRAFDDWHGTKPTWKTFDGVLEVRNAIAHGHGVLTRRQSHNRKATLDRIKRAGASVDSNDRVVIDREAVARIAEECRRLIREIDRALK